MITLDDAVAACARPALEVDDVDVARPGRGRSGETQLPGARSEDPPPGPPQGDDEFPAFTTGIRRVIDEHRRSTRPHGYSKSQGAALERRAVLPVGEVDGL